MLSLFFSILLNNANLISIPYCVELCEANAMASSGVHEDLMMPMFFFWFYSRWLYDVNALAMQSAQGKREHCEVSAMKLRWSLWKNGFGLRWDRDYFMSSLHWTHNTCMITMRVIHESNAVCMRITLTLWGQRDVMAMIAFEKSFWSTLRSQLLHEIIALNS